MARDTGKLQTILSNIGARLQSQLSVGDGACYLALDPDLVPTSFPGPGTFAYVFGPLSGEFDQGMLDGGGVYQATASTGIFVKIYSTVMLDSPGRDGNFLTHATLGILEQWRLVLKALTNYSPVDGSNNQLTRDPLFPAGFRFTRQDKSIGAIEQDFALLFDEDVVS